MSLYNDLQNRANNAGVSLRGLCKELNIPIESIYGWNRKVPIQLQRYAALRDEIEKRTADQ
jgi:hypothetical protein